MVAHVCGSSWIASYRPTVCANTISGRFIQPTFVTTQRNLTRIRCRVNGAIYSNTERWIALICPLAAWATSEGGVFMYFVPPGGISEGGVFNAYFVPPGDNS